MNMRPILLALAILVIFLLSAFSIHLYYLNVMRMTPPPPAINSESASVLVEANPYLSATSTVISKMHGKGISAEDIERAIIAESSARGVEMQKGRNFGSYDLFSGHGSFQVDMIAKGDLNGDGLKDAFLFGNWCAASCGTKFIVFLNNDTSLSAINANPEGIVSAGAAQYVIKKVSIQQGLIFIYYNAGEPSGSADDVLKYSLESVGDGSHYRLNLK